MVEQVSQLGSYDFFSVSTIMSTCVKVLTMFTQLHVRKQWDVIITNLPHLLNKVIYVLVFLLKRYSESLMSESSLSDHNGNMFSCFCNTLKEEIFEWNFIFSHTNASTNTTLTVRILPETIARDLGIIRLCTGTMTKNILKQLLLY